MLKTLLQTFRENRSQIVEWLDSKRELYGAHPLYASVDVRNAGFKLAPVDTNLFPAGWNNLCPSYARRASDLFKQYISENFPATQCIVIVPENHTRNLHYFSNVKRLQEIIANAGFDTKIGSINPEITKPTEFKTAEDESLMLYPVERDGDKLIVDGQKVCRFVANNDFSDGIPEILADLPCEMLLPPPQIGWHSRKKSEHFGDYRKLIEEFAELVDTPVWHFVSEYDFVQGVDIGKDEDRERLAQVVEALLKRIAERYQEYGIANEPTVFVKSDAGTYGMAIMSVTSGDQIREINRKGRNKMSVSKSGVAVTDLIVQEGVPTTDRIKGFIAEPVIYLVGNRSTGGFYRLNTEKGDNDNLNARGMQFTKLCFEQALGYENTYAPDLDAETMSELYTVIATVASLAAGQEIMTLFNK